MEKEKTSGSFEKEIIFEGGASASVTISYRNVAPINAIQVMSV